MLMHFRNINDTYINTTKVKIIKLFLLIIIKESMYDTYNNTTSKDSWIVELLLFVIMKGSK